MNNYLSLLLKALPISLMLLTVAVCAADDLETTKEAAEKGDSFAQFNLGFHVLPRRWNGKRRC